MTPPPFSTMLAQDLECAFFDAADVGARNAKQLRDLALGVGRIAAKTVAKDDDAPLTLVQHLIHKAADQRA